MRPTLPRPVRAARLLAVLLAPLIALPALSGLVVCASAAGVTTSWSERPCPKKRSGLPAADAPRNEASVCVAAPETAPALPAAALDLPAPSAGPPSALVAVPAVAPRPGRSRAPAPRGPPVAALDALRTVVLRV